MAPVVHVANSAQQTDTSDHTSDRDTATDARAARSAHGDGKCTEEPRISAGSGAGTQGLTVNKSHKQQPAAASKKLLAQPPLAIDCHREQITQTAGGCSLEKTARTAAIAH